MHIAAPASCHIRTSRHSRANSTRSTSASARRGSGLGRELLRLSLDWIAQTYPGPVWLGVWSGNAKAQAFYGTKGFRKVGDYHFMVGDHRDDEYIYRRD